MIAIREFNGWNKNIYMTNGVIELYITLEVGPRIISFSFADGENIFKEFSEQQGKAGENEFMSRGGHRLWTAPEAKPRTYYPDNEEIMWKELSEYSVLVMPPAEVENGIQKSMQVTISKDSDAVTVTHYVSNIGAWDIELAPWAITVMRTNGTAIVPLAEKKPHTDVLVPEYPLVVWPYTYLDDKRYHFGSKYITFSQDEKMPPSKIGLGLTKGFAAYQYKNDVFVKYFDYDCDEVYPDMGCNFETFSNEEFLEVESLGALTTIAPGESTMHIETWRMLRVDKELKNDEDIDKYLLPLI